MTISNSTHPNRSSNILFDTFSDRSNGMHVHEEMNRDLVIIPKRDRSKKTEAIYSKHDWVTVINITKPEQAECFICEFCSVKSLTRLEIHKEEKHRNEK